MKWNSEFAQLYYSCQHRNCFKWPMDRWRPDKSQVHGLSTMLILVSPQDISLECRWQMLDVTPIHCPNDQRTDWGLIWRSVKESRLATVLGGHLPPLPSPDSQSNPKAQVCVCVYVGEKEQFLSLNNSICSCTMDISIQKEYFYYLSHVYMCGICICGAHSQVCMCVRGICWVLPLILCFAYVFIYVFLYQKQAVSLHQSYKCIKTFPAFTCPLGI